MTREFQILYRFTQHTGTVTETPVGEVMTCLAIAEAEDQLREQFKAAGIRVVGINFVRAVVDWSQPNFNRDEAAEFVRTKPDTLSVNKGSGHIPFATIGKGIYPRVLLEQYVENNLNESGKTLRAANRRKLAA